MTIATSPQLDAQTDAPVLRVSGLNAYYGRIQALFDLDFEIASGGVTALLGANGAGKTTTLRALCAMIPTRGEILFDGKSIADRATEDIVALGVAHVPEGRGTFVGLSVEENLQLGAMTRRDRRAIAQDIERMYGLFPRLAERRAQQAHTLSGGEQQMLAISRALMLRPKLLLLDEPSFGLAPRLVEDLFKTLQRLKQEDGIAMLLVEQNAAMALAIADHAYLIETGRVVMSGPASEIGRDESIRRAYLGY